MHEARESGWMWGDWRFELAVAAGLGAFVGLIGPFGTFLYGPTALRVLYWSGMFVVGGGLFGVGVRAALRLGARIKAPEALSVGIAVTLLTGPVAWIASKVDTSLWPRAARFVTPLAWYGEALVVSLPFSAFVLWLRRQGAARSRSADIPQPSQRPSANIIASEVLCLQMEDHYVRVHTRVGSQLHYATFSQALAAVHGEDGRQVHRSWWVARRAVTRVHYVGRKVELELVTGLRAPVARASVAGLKAAEWLAS